MGSTYLLVESTVKDIETIRLFKRVATGEFVLEQGEKCESYVSADDAQDMYVEWLTNAILVSGAMK